MGDYLRPGYLLGGKKAKPYVAEKRTFADGNAPPVKFSEARAARNATRPLPMPIEKLVVAQQMRAAGADATTTAAAIGRSVAEVARVDALPRLGARRDRQEFTD